MNNFIHAMQALPQASPDVIRHMAFYHKSAKATRVLLATSLETGGDIKVLDLTHDEFFALTCVKGVVRKERRSNARSEHDGKKAIYHYRLNVRAIREAVLAYSMDVKDLPLFGGLNWRTKKRLKADQAAFCKRFDCRLQLEPENEEDFTKVYTQGDCTEFLLWCDLGGDPEHWRKNSRSYKVGTDYDIYEIKSAVSNYAPSALWIGINSVI